MSIIREAGAIVFECDGGCGARVETDEKGFEEALAVFQTGEGEDWLVTKASGDWEHYCGESGDNCKESQLEL